MYAVEKQKNSCLALLQWSGTKPTISPRYACAHTHTDMSNAKYILNVHGSLNYSTQTECPIASQLPKKWTVDPLGATYTI